jgi:hypothetical protein
MEMKPTKKNSPAIKVGRNPNNKPAEVYVENGTGIAAMKAAISRKPDPNTMSSKEFVKHYVGTNTLQPINVGDERYDTSTNKLYKTIVLNGLMITIHLLMTNIVMLLHTTPCVISLKMT